MTLTSWEQAAEKYHTKSARSEPEALKNIRVHIEAFRKREWHNIRREVVNEYGIDADLVRDEPLWTEPGRAFYYRDVKVRRIEDVEGEVDRRGNTRQNLVEHKLGWQLTGSLPAYAPDIAYQLRKGFRLRHPDTVSEVSVEETPEEPASPDGSPKPEELFCATHNFRTTNFRQWREHCRTRRENVGPPPAGQTWEHWCDQHGVGYKNEKAWKKHQSTHKIRT